MTKEKKAIRKAKKEYDNIVNSYKHTMKQSLDECKLVMSMIPEPVYKFEIGDRCEYGAFDWSGVLEVCESGKYYKLFSVNFHRNTSYKIHYEVWFNLGVYRENWDDTPVFKENDDIIFNYQQRDMRYLLSLMCREYGIDLEPEYQRGLVWNKDQKLSLIDSIYKNIDIGKFTIIKRPWGNDPTKPKTPKLYEMLDGKQRITALWEFYTCQFKYNGKYFFELTHSDRSHFKNFKISYAECEPLTNEQKYRYFLKLNTTGVAIDKKHIESVNKLLIKEKEKK